MKNIAVKNCPLCGREVSVQIVVVNRRDDMDVRVSCACGLHFVPCDGDVEAVVRRWNRRNGER